MADGKVKAGAQAPAPGTEEAEDPNAVELAAVAWLKGFITGSATIEVKPLAGGGWAISLGQPQG